MRRLLVIACSQSKSREAGLIPAIERYDGPAFRVIRKYLRESRDLSLKIWIISAKFGLLESSQPIPDYDCQMSRISALALRSEISSAARKLIDSERWDRIGLSAGMVYRFALGDSIQVGDEVFRLELLDGGLGSRLSRLKAWLRSTESADLLTVAGRIEGHSARKASSVVNALECHGEAP